MEIELIEKIIIKGKICVKTGLRIGGPESGLKIGGIDNPVVTDPEGKPYIPGSSLKGKLRSLIEKKEKVSIENGFHQCKTDNDYQNCAICKIWGVLASDNIKNLQTLTRLIVRDSYLIKESITEEMRKNLELEWTEVKMETAIDRVSGKAFGLRTFNRIPAGAMFDMELIYNVYDEKDKEILIKLFESMELLEHDYLGGMGSRGYGKIKFDDIKIFCNKKENYENGNLNDKPIYEAKLTEEELKNDVSLVAKIVKEFDNIKQNL